MSAQLSLEQEREIEKTVKLPRMCAAGQREFATVLQNQTITASRTPLVSCEGYGIVRVPLPEAVVVNACPCCGAAGRQPVVT